MEYLLFDRRWARCWGYKDAYSVTRLGRKQIVTTSRGWALVEKSSVRHIGGHGNILPSQRVATDIRESFPEEEAPEFWRIRCASACGAVLTASRRTWAPLGEQCCLSSHLLLNLLASTHSTGLPPADSRGFVAFFISLDPAILLLWPHPHLVVLIFSHHSLSSSWIPLRCGPQNVWGTDLGKWVSSDITKTQEGKWALGGENKDALVQFGDVHRTEERRERGQDCTRRWGGISVWGEFEPALDLPFPHPSFLKVRSFLHFGHLSNLPSHFHLHAQQYSPLFLSQSVPVVSRGS